MRAFIQSGVVLLLVLVTSAAFAQSGNAELESGSPQLVTPEDMVKLLQAPKAEKPLILNVGPWLMYRQAHIPDSEYVGASGDKQGLEQLRKRVKSLPHTQAIVLYCGCCPWSHCPNVHPAFKELSTMGFSNVKVLYIADNFGADWVYKGYPTVKGE